MLIVFGTRPEAIKMAPIIKKMEAMRSSVKMRVCVTAQHREMLDQILEVFEIEPDYDLDIMKQNQDLFDITSIILLKLKKIIDEFSPDVILVHGDTTTACVTALASFYSRVRIAHIEAGLRTYNIYSPWPEEANRQIIGILSSLHFSPTKRNADNLLKEGKERENVCIVGNTVIDALFFVLNKINNDENFRNQILTALMKQYRVNNGNRFILVTGHRRENFGKGFMQICEALKEIALNNPEIDIIYPVHLNPNVQKPVRQILSNIPNIYLINPLRYEEFVYLMNMSYMIITDSGGIQEEAPSLGKPVLVMRDTTERLEAIDVGAAKLVGTTKQNIVKEVQKLLDNKEAYVAMSKAGNPYGDGKASEKIISILLDKVK